MVSLIERRRWSRRSVATGVAALWAALLIALAAVAPVLAVEGHHELDNPGVSPRTGTTTTTISFDVRYRDRGAPRRITSAS